MSRKGADAEGVVSIGGEMILGWGIVIKVERRYRSGELLLEDRAGRGFSE